MRILVILLMAALCTGCVESYFRLSEDSRLPRWFEIPEGNTRAQYSVKLTYYTSPFGRTAVLKLKDDEGWFYGKRIKVDLDGDMPNYLSDSVDRNPAYEIARKNGVVDVIGHKGKNDIFFMTDNPKVWEELGLSKP